MTGAYNLPCQKIIHTVGPVWHGGMFGEKEKLSLCYRNTLELAIENGIRSIAFPSISTGAYGYPVDEAALVALETVQLFLDTHPGKLDVVKYVLFDEKTEMAYLHAFEKMTMNYKK